MDHRKEEEQQLRENVRHSEGQMPVKIYSCIYSEKLTSILSHWHQEIEVALICSGKTSYQVGGIEFLAHEGDILVISPCVLHGVRKLPRVTCKTESIVCDLHMFCSAATDGAIYQLFLPIIAQKRRFKTLIRPGDPAYEQIFSCVSSAISCYNNRIRYWEILFKKHMLYLFYLLLDNNYLQTPGEGDSDPKNEEVIRNVLDYISDHLSENLSIEKLAAISKYSPSHFMKVFKQNTGITCNQFVLQHRLDYATKLLQESSQSVTEVALNCGFNNISYFIHCFHKQFLCTPAAYRKIAQQQSHN